MFFPKETFIAKIILCKRKAKAMVVSLDGDTKFFDIVTGVLHGHKLAPYLFTHCLEYVLWALIDLMKQNCFTLKKSRSRRYTTDIMTDAENDYAALLINTPDQEEPHSLAARTIEKSLYINKTDYMF